MWQWQQQRQAEQQSRVDNSEIKPTYTKKVSQINQIKLGKHYTNWVAIPGEKKPPHPIPYTEINSTWNKDFNNKNSFS